MHWRKNGVVLALDVTTAPYSLPLLYRCVYIIDKPGAAVMNTPEATLRGENTTLSCSIPIPGKYGLSAVNVMRYWALRRRKRVWNSPGELKAKYRRRKRGVLAKNMCECSPLKETPQKAVFTTPIMLYTALYRSYINGFCIGKVNLRGLNVRKVSWFSALAV